MGVTARSGDCGSVPPGALRDLELRVSSAVVNADLMRGSFSYFRTSDRRGTDAQMSRQPKEIDEKQFRALCELQCTLPEFASVFQCSQSTIDRWCQREYGKTFGEAYKEFSPFGKMSLRRSLFRLSTKNAAVAIFMAKQYLGMSDAPQAEEDSDTAQQITRLGELLWKGKKTYGAAAASSDAPEQQGEGPGSGSTPSADAAPPAVIKAKPAKGKAAPRKGVKSK